MVTPTYYVFFTSSTIVTSAVLFQGFHGTAITITTVVMGFLQICSGVVLLQLSKSSKDVPDAAVFSGDLDQMRTMAEQEEPEYEPRADTIRGGGALIRSLSTARMEKQVAEAKRIAKDKMEPINENEEVEWDGLRRRKTTMGPGRAATVRRQMTIHPPLGMSQIPSDESNHSGDDDDIHPGFFHRLRSRRHHGAHAPATTAVGLSSLRAQSPVPSVPSIPQTEGTVESASNRSHIYGLPPGLRKDMEQNTSYQPPGSRGSPTSGSSLGPPKPPPHTAKRQFSFQDVFHRHRADGGSTSDAAAAAAASPTSGSGRPSTSRRGVASRDPDNIDSATEEERLGLVKGDSENLLAVPGVESSPEFSDSSDVEDWQLASRGPSPGPGGSAGPGAGADAKPPSGDRGGTPKAFM